MSYVTLVDVQHSHQLRVHVFCLPRLAHAALRLMQLMRLLLLLLHRRCCWELLLLLLP
jgi:hypothetical protein